MKRRKILLLILAACTLTAGLWLFYVRPAYVLPRYTDYTTYEPFSGKIFQIDPSIVSKIHIANGNRVDYGGSGVYVKKFETPEEIAEITEYLNSFRYSFWRPDWQDVSHFGGYSYKINLYLNSDAIPGDYLGCRFGENYVIIDGIYYYGDPAFFQKLIDYVE